LHRAWERIRTREGTNAGWAESAKKKAQRFWEFYQRTGQRDPKLIDEERRVEVQKKGKRFGTGTKR